MSSLCLKVPDSNICLTTAGSCFSRAEENGLKDKDLMQGMQQHPHVTKIAMKTAMKTSIDMMTPFQAPNVLLNQSSTGLSIPEWLCISLERGFNPSNALVTFPSGAVLFGMKLQHRSPNILHTPPFQLVTCLKCHSVQPLMKSELVLPHLSLNLIISSHYNESN